MMNEIKMPTSYAVVSQVECYDVVGGATVDDSMTRLNNVGKVFNYMARIFSAMSSVINNINTIYNSILSLNKLFSDGI